MEDCFMWKDSRVPSGQEPSLSITASLICLLESDSVTREAVFVGMPGDLCNFKTQFFLTFSFHNSPGSGFYSVWPLIILSPVHGSPLIGNSCSHTGGVAVFAHIQHKKKDFPKGFLVSWKRKLKVKFCFFSWYCLSWHGCFSFFFFAETKNTLNVNP